LRRDHQSAYDDVTTGRCERALVTLLGDIGPWGERIYLVGGWRRGTSSERFREESRRTLVRQTWTCDRPCPRRRQSETYRTLANNLKTSGFTAEMSFRWKRSVDGVAVTVEFLCETDEVEPGKIFRPRADAGSALGAFNVRGAQLVTRDYLSRAVEADRLDGVDCHESTFVSRTSSRTPF